MIYILYIYINIINNTNEESTHLKKKKKKRNKAVDIFQTVKIDIFVCFPKKQGVMYL